MSKTKQRSYEWRGSFATAAITAVQDFWKSDSQYASAEDRANFVEWAIPNEDEEPSPFTWASVDETNGDEIVSTSSQASGLNILIGYILTNFRYIKVSSSHPPSSQRSARISLQFPTSRRC
jgi:hypothetical protein